jgi:hypothetical protein
VHTLSVVAVNLVDVNVFTVALLALQSVTGMHWRSDVAVGATLWYWGVAEKASHVCSAWHSVLAVLVAGAFSNSKAAEQVATALHSTVESLLWTSPEKTYWPVGQKLKNWHLPPPSAPVSQRSVVQSEFEEHVTALASRLLRVPICFCWHTLSAPAPTGT